jgi:hypothetical protein
MISQNVIGIFKPESKNIKKRVIYSAHIDSAFRFNLIEFIKHGYAYFIIIIYIYLILFLLIYVFQIIFNIFHISFVILIIILNWIIIIIPIVFAVASLVIGRKPKLFEGIFSKMSPIGAFVILFITFYNLLINILFLNYVFIQPDLIKTIVFLFFITIPTFIAMLFFVSRKATPGVIDNLTGVAPFICLAKILKEWKEKYPNLYPQNTEVIIAIVGCEEVGLRGAEAFANKHAKEYNNIDTTCVNIDSLTESRWQTILKREDTTRTDLSPEVYNLLAECCKDLGIKHQIIKLSAFGGGTDAVGLIRGGLKAASLMGMSIQDYLYYYHTSRDDLNLLNKERRPRDDIGDSWKNRNVRCAMENALKISLKYLEKIDKK